MISSNIHAASFRDPSGFLFYRDGTLCRQINRGYKAEYDHLLSTGLYEELVGAGVLIGHEEMTCAGEDQGICYKVIRPAFIPFVSYPYEWCFSQLKSAALTTLTIQKKALDRGMSLKDASAYNMQFIDGSAVLIDTLSFERYPEGRPWIAYRQFCQHFLAPLALMAFRDVRLNSLLSLYIDGVPLDVASGLLPFRTKLSIPLMTHIHLHAKSQKRFGDTKVDLVQKRMSRYALDALIDNLESAVRALQWTPRDTLWADYYEDTNYTPAAFEHKEKIVAEMLDISRPGMVVDLGANTGKFSRMASGRGIFTLAVDSDPSAVERNYRQVREKGERNMLPLLLDITNPSPAIGWENAERSSWMSRASADTVLALALIHHLAISHNLPLCRLADFFRKMGKFLVVEFIPKNDSQVVRLLRNREDIFGGYTQENFEKEFQKYFSIMRKRPLAESGRCLYLMKGNA